MIDYLKLAEDNEAKVAATAIGRISGPLTAEIVAGYVELYRELGKQIEGGLDAPVCPELTNANPSSPHTVIIEAISWMQAQQAYRLNQIPLQNNIAFANLFDISRRPATAAVTTLRFTATTAPTSGTAVNIPIGTEVQSEDGLYVFHTTAAVTRNGNGTVDAPAERTIAGHTLLSAGVLTHLGSVPAYVTAVTNQSAVDSGSEQEELSKTLERVRRFQRRGLRIVSAQDFADALLDDALLGNGIVRVFEKIENGDFTSGVRKPGYVTAIVMTRTGEPVDSATKSRCSALADQIVGNIFAYVVDPFFVTFDVTANVKLQAGTLQSAVLALAERNLRNFYAAAASRFGKGIYEGDIIALIEGTAGVDHIPNGQLASPAIDTDLQEYQMPKLVNVTLNAV